MKRVHIWMAVDTDGSVITSVIEPSTPPVASPYLRLRAEECLRQTFEDEDNCEEQVARTLGSMCQVLMTLEADTEEQLACGLVAGHPDLFAPGFHHVSAAREIVRTLAVDVDPLPAAPSDQVADLIAHIAERLSNSSDPPTVRWMLLEMLKWYFVSQGPSHDECTACGKEADCIAHGALRYSICAGCLQTAVLDLVAVSKVSAQATDGAPC